MTQQFLFRDLLTFSTSYFMFLDQSGQSRWSKKIFNTGGLTAGLVLDKLKRHRYFILFSCTCLMGFITAILPHVMYLWAFFVASTISNFATGVLHPSLNVLCLDIWAEDSGPFLNSLHFGFAVNTNTWITCLRHLNLQNIGIWIFQIFVLILFDDSATNNLRRLLD